MEVASYCIVDEAFLIYRFISSIVPEYGFFVPFALHWICATILSWRCCIAQLRIQQWVSVQDLFLVPAFDLLHFCKLFKVLLLFSLLLQFFILTHKLFCIVIFTRVIPILITIAIFIWCIGCLILVISCHFCAFRLGPKVSGTFKLDEICILCERVFDKG